MKTPTSGGGWKAIAYSLRKAREAGGLLRFWRALRSKNACKTCALGMGGQRGGMVNEVGQFPEVCKKSMQAMAADMQGRIEPRFFEEYGFDALRQFSPRELEGMGRLAEPVFAGPTDTRYHPVPWEWALDFCARKLRDAKPDENFFYFSGRSSNEAGFLLQLFARVYGTNNVNNCSFYCHQASGVGLNAALGTGTATIELDDLDHCDLFILIGGNPASNHPRLMRKLMELRRRGGEVIVINPLREVGLVNFRVPSDVRSLLFGSEIATQYVQPHIGGDIALLTGVARAVVDLARVPDAVDGCPTVACGAIPLEWIRSGTTGFAEWLTSVRSASWSQIESAAGVPRPQIERIALTYLACRAAIFGWTMGITHHLHGVDNVRAIVNLALLRGMVGRPGAGLLPIRGHSNVQGIGSVGVTPQLKDAVFARLQAHFGVRLPTTPGLDTLSCVDAMRDGRVRHAWCLGGNLFGSNPDAAATHEAFARLDSVVYLNTTLNTGHAWGRANETLILPVKARDEESQATTQESMFNYVRLSDGGAARMPGPRSEVEVISAIARGALGDGGPIDWASLEQHRNIRAAIAAIIPGYEEIGRIDQTRREFQIEGRTIRPPANEPPRFRTPDGRARFFVAAIPEDDPPAGALRLMTIRSEGQFNTVVYEEEDLYRGQDRRDIILMNSADMQRLGLREDWRVTVRSSVGEMKNILVRPFEIRAGNAAMYAPEANILVPRTADPESRTPAFKSVVVMMIPQLAESQRVSLQVLSRR